MLGFLGTVMGMVQAFYDMANAGNNLDITVLSTGIYQAMVTTVAGLIVGIIAYFAYNILVSNIEKVVYKMEATTTAPPWQVRWKRPRWDRVVLGIDDAAADSGSTGVANESEIELDENWTPVSSSSAVRISFDARRSRPSNFLLPRRSEVVAFFPT